MKTHEAAPRARARLCELARDYFGVAVSSATPLRGDASTRAYVRLAHPGGAEATSVGMVLPAPFDKHALPFLDVGAHLAQIGLRVPRVFTMDEAAGVVLLEDCGDESLEDAWRTGGWRGAQTAYERAVDMIAAMQEAPAAPGRVACTRRFDAAFFTDELRHTRTYAFERLLGMETDARALDAAFFALCEEVCRSPFRLTHRDYHSRNLMVAGEAVYVLDFQDARMGPALYDLASLAFDSYVDLGAARARLLARYWETCGHRHFSDKEEYEHALRATAIQRNLKAIGTFAYQKAARGAERYLASIPHTVGMLREHFDERRDLARLRGLLERFLDALVT